MRCASRNCRTERAEGSRFCAEHRDLLARVAADIENGKRLRRKSPEIRNKRKTPKLCDADGCYEYALPREPYCAEHMEDLIPLDLEARGSQT
jgi:hypothetical protein